MQRPKIGILAGMGPHSTAPFLEALNTEAELQTGATQEGDFPRFVICTLPTPFVAGECWKHDAMERVLESGIDDVTAAQVDFIAIACNTAHIFLPKLSAMSRLPILNMIQITVDSIPAEVIKVAVIASSSVTKAELYERALQRSQKQLVPLDSSKVDALIRMTSEKVNLKGLNEVAYQLLDKAQSLGAQIVIIACLDLGEVFRNLEHSTLRIDAGRCLAHEVIRRWKSTSKSADSERISGYVISTDNGYMRPEIIHGFLSNEAYWCKNIPYETFMRALKNSLNFGIFHGELKEGRQVGFARVVTDKATFAWLCDVYIDQAHRGLGLSKWMMDQILKHPDLQGLRRFSLATKDAHSLYEKYGFSVIADPSRAMEILYTASSLYI